MPPQRWHCNRPDRVADQTGSLVRLPERGRDEPTRGPGTRDTYVTLRWLVEPSGAEALGCVGLVVSKCLADPTGADIPGGQGNVHAQLSQDPYPYTVSPVHIGLSKDGSHRSRLVGWGPSGGHVISGCRCRLAIKHCGCPRLAAAGHLRSGKRFARTTVPVSPPVVTAVGTRNPLAESRVFPEMPTHLVGRDQLSNGVT